MHLFHTAFHITQIEADIFCNEVIPRKPEGEWSKVAPLRILSFDIECQGRKGYFPEAEHDPVIQIANSLSVYGDKSPIVQNVFTLKGCLPIVGAQVLSSNTEQDMLLKWRAFVHASDADIFTGYNVQVRKINFFLFDCTVLLINHSKHCFLISCVELRYPILA